MQLGQLDGILKLSPLINNTKAHLEMRPDVQNSEPPSLKCNKNNGIEKCKHTISHHRKCTWKFSNQS